jgi:hypothetical protein
MLGKIQSPANTLCTIADASMVGSTRPKSDVFPRSITAASLMSQNEAARNARLRPGVLAIFPGYDSNGSLSDAPDPFEFDSPTCGQSEDCTSSSVLGFGVSETVSAISNSGMLQDSGTCGLAGDTTIDFDNALGTMFLDTTDESDSETEPAYESSAACPSSRACLSIVPDAYLASHTKDAGSRSYTNGSHATIDECPDLGEEAFLFSIRAREHDGASPTTDGQSMSQVALDVLERAAMFLHRPMTMARCLESMAAGRLGALLTPWRAQLDPTCEFHLVSVDAGRRVEVTMTKDVATEQIVRVEDMACHLPLPIPVDSSRTTRSALTRSRSKTMLAVPVTLPPLVPTRRNTSYAQYAGQLSPGPWETVSAPPTPSVLVAPAPAGLNPYAVASSSRVPAVSQVAATGIVRSDALPRKRRNTREMFIESQVAHVLKGSRGMGATRRSGSRVPKKKPAPVERLDLIYADELDQVEGEENSTDWIVVPSAPALSPRMLSKSPAQRTLYASPSKGSYLTPRRARAGAGMNKSPSVRSGMVKSPSVRSGLAKSGSRQGLSASQSRSALHVSQARTGTRAHTRGSSSHGARFPVSPSTRSLPGSQQGAVGNTSPPPRPPRSRVRPRVERRRPGGWDAGEKENLPAGSVPGKEGDENMSGPESPLRCRSTSQRRAVFESPNPTLLYEDPQPTRPRVPGLESLPKRNPEDMMRAPTKALAAEAMSHSLDVRRAGTPIVPPRSPARPAARNLV